MFNELDLKVDKVTMMDYLDKKGSKTDLEMALRLINVVHNHTTQIIQNLVELQRAQIEAHQGDLESMVINKRNSNFNTAILLCKQIQKFDVSSIQDVFQTNNIKEFIPTLEKSKITFKSHNKKTVVR